MATEGHWSPDLAAEDFFHSALPKNTSIIIEHGQGLLFWAVYRDLKGSSQGDIYIYTDVEIDVDVEVDVDIDSYLGGYVKETLKSV